MHVMPRGATYYVACLSCHFVYVEVDSMWGFNMDFNVGFYYGLQFGVLLWIQCGVDINADFVYVSL